MKRRKTRFEIFSRRFLLAAIVLFVFGNIGIKAVDSAYNTNKQNLEKEIRTIESSIDGLNMQKQELVSFDRLNEIAGNKGYSYRNDAVASYITSPEVVDE